MSNSLVYLSGLENPVIKEWRSKSRNLLYRRDPEAWLWDVLGYRWHAKQREIAADFMDNRRIGIKSSNGAGKSRQMGELISWGVAVHDPGELLVITSAPTSRQIEETTFAYLSANYGRAKARGFAFPGYLTDSTHWNWRQTPSSKSKTLVLGQKPSDRDIIGSFQGVRAIGGANAKTWVVIDEGGAVHDDLFVSAEAVTTGAADNKIVTIGNPDRVGTYFQRIFQDPDISRDWKTHTISALDLPTFTGEVVYEDEEMQRQMLESGMIDPEWVEQKKRAWGEDSARYLSKVLGEFPDSDDHCFFPQSSINKAADTHILEDWDNDLVLGFDVARFGEDDSMVYRNRGGRIRREESWSKASTLESVNRIHSLALETEAPIVVMDAVGLGAGVYDQLAARADRYYTVIGARGSERSPDPTRWANARAYWYDKFREGMQTGLVDLDFSDDRQLYDELLMVQFDFNNRGAIQIESKKDMARRGVKSPDALDAAVYSFIKAREIADNPLNTMKPGETVVRDPWEDVETMAGMPI